MNWEAAKRACFARDEEKCRRCSRPATDCHHRKLKQMGGSSDEELLYGLANLVSLCRSCHSWVHLHVTESREQGWIVPSWDDPEDVPLKPAERAGYEF